MFESKVKGRQLGREDHNRLKPHKHELELQKDGPKLSILVVLTWEMRVLYRSWGHLLWSQTYTTCLELEKLKGIQRERRTIAGTAAISRPGGDSADQQ